MFELGEMKVFLRENYELSPDIVDVLIRKKTVGGFNLLDAEGTWVFIDEGRLIPHDFKYIRLPVNSLKALSNALADRGITPDKVQSYENVLDSTRKHLEDMRKLVFGKR